MKVFAYAHPKFESSFVVQIITMEGFILDAFECYSYKKAPEIAQMRAERLSPGCDLQWLSEPWLSGEFKDAKRKYRTNYNLDSWN